MMIPQSLAITLLAGLPERFGLFTSFYSSMAYAIFGTCPQMSIGPEAVVAILIGMQVSAFETEHDKIAAASVLTLLVAGITLFLGLFRLGKLKENI